MAIAKILYKSFYWKIFQFIVSFVINIVFVRIFQSAVAAEFYSLVYLLSLAVGFFTLGLDIGLSYYLALGKLSWAMAVRIILALVITALLISLPLIHMYYRPARYPDLTAPDLLLFSALAIAGGLLTTLSGTLFTAKDRNYITGQVAFMANLLLLLISLAAAFMVKGERVVKTLFGIYFVFSFLQGIFLLVRSRRLYPRPTVAIPPLRSTHPAAPPRPTDPAPAGEKQALLQTIFRFSSGAFIVNFLFFAGPRVCLYFMPYWVQPAELGNYIQAYKVVEYLAAFIAFVYYPFMTFVASGSTERTEEMVLFLVRLSNTFVLIVTVFFLACGWSLFPFIFGRSFSRMYLLFIWFIPGAFAVGASSFFTAYYFGKGNLNYNFVSCCIQFGAMLLLFFLFIPFWGAAGAALAFSLSSLLSLFYDCRIFKKFSAYRYRELLLVGKADIARIILFLRETWTPARLP